jgi:hypothetical protein
LARFPPERLTQLAEDQGYERETATT